MPCMPGNPKRVVLLIDDVPGNDRILRAAVQRACACANGPSVELEVVQVMPDSIPQRSHPPIPSLETFLTERAPEVCACLIDCDLGDRSLSFSKDLETKARAGYPPFPVHFAGLPIAFLTAQIDLSLISQQLDRVALPKIPHGDKWALADWLRSVLSSFAPPPP